MPYIQQPAQILQEIHISYNQERQSRDVPPSGLLYTHKDHRRPKPSPGICTCNRIRPNQFLIRGRDSLLPDKILPSQGTHGDIHWNSICAIPQRSPYVKNSYPHSEAFLSPSALPAHPGSSIPTPRGCLLHRIPASHQSLCRSRNRYRHRSHNWQCFR